MRVLILSVTAGFGHHATGKAVADMLISRDVAVHTVDVYEYINKGVKEAIDKGYLFTSKHTQELYRSGYMWAESGSSYLPHKPLSPIRMVNALGAHKFARMIADFSPDIIVCTHIFAAQLMNHMKKRKYIVTPTVGIITDYTIHPYWEDVPMLEHIVLASELLRHRAIKKGIAADKLLCTGIPIHPKFNESIDRNHAIAQLGLSPDRPIILLMGGSMGYSNNRDIIARLHKCNMPFQVLVVCGRNQKQYEEMCEMAQAPEGLCTLHPYGFVDNVEVMMSAADCIISKPGGLTVSEALAKNLPMILVNPIPGHEERNVEFLLNNGLAMMVTKTFPADEAVYHLFQSPGRLQQMRETMHILAHADATERLADFIIDYPLQPCEQPELPAEDDAVLLEMQQAVRDIERAVEEQLQQEQ